MSHILRNAFGQPYLIITHDAENNWIYNEWRGVLSVNSVMQGADAVLGVMRQTGCQYLLNDNCAVVGSWNQANDWIAQTWMPKALELGLRRFAHLAPAGTFVQASAEEMKKRVNDRFAMALFTTAQEGTAWLREAQTASAAAAATAAAE
ncbi:MAG: hypothetical protein H7330_12510 [Hymenobacteraceae bacterium]|nr:hypothetical protein [Hymenobacteraceae bacterium]